MAKFKDNPKERGALLSRAKNYPVHRSYISMAAWHYPVHNLRLIAEWLDSIDLKRGELEKCTIKF